MVGKLEVRLIKAMLTQIEIVTFSGSMTISKPVITLH
jgi:hypothetical protein